MSEPPHAAAAAAADDDVCTPGFSDLWRTVSKLYHRKTRDKKPGDQMMPGTGTTTTTSPLCKDLQSPRRRSWYKYPGLNNGDSPGESETSQDIVWDSTSPTPANTGSGLRKTRVVEISDIVNRIAPKDVKTKGTDLLQWIGDSAMPCTPEIPKQRVRKKSSRRSSVEDLMKLARQFDENMQQDKETCEQPNPVSSNLNEHATTSETRPTQTSLPSDAKDANCPSSSDRAEAELRALFDCSTQSVGGQLSESSGASACSQEVKDRPATSASAQRRQSEPESADRSGSAAHPAEEKGSCGYSANSCDDFDDDWENDDLLNDSFVLSMTVNPDEQHDTTPKTTFPSDTETDTAQFTSVCEPTVNINLAHRPSNSDCKPSCSALRELCPKPKTTNRSTFKLEPNPHFRARTAGEVSKSNFTVARPKSETFDRRSATAKTPSNPGTDRVTTDQRRSEDSVKDISDSLWDDGTDDALFYQVCDSVERISNSQPQPASPSTCPEKPDTAAVDRRWKATKPLPTDKAWSKNAGASANRQPPCAFVRSNSLPGPSCEAVNYRGWNIPMKSANNQSRMSRSFPGGRVSPGTFGRRGDPPGSFQAGNANPDVKPHTVTAREPQNSKTHHAAFKRNVADSAAVSNKVFVTSQMKAKCSAAEIERKKQEALAKRRQRMQNTSKP